MTSRWLTQSVLFLHEGVLGWFMAFAWWYTDGLSECLQWIQKRLRFKWRSVGLSLWVKHLFESMYGQQDFTGRAISIVMRFVVLIGRSIALVISFVGYVFLLAVWVLLPVTSFVLLGLNVLALL